MTIILFAGQTDRYELVHIEESDGMRSGDSDEILIAVQGQKAWPGWQNGNGVEYLKDLWMRTEKRVGGGGGGGGRP
jgi:hypothetical protein